MTYLLAYALFGLACTGAVWFVTGAWWWRIVALWPLLVAYAGLVTLGTILGGRERI